MNAVDPGGAVFAALAALMFIPSWLQRRRRNPRLTRRQYAAQVARTRRAVAFAEECLDALTAMTRERDHYRQLYGESVAREAVWLGERSVVHDRLAVERDNATLARLEAETWPGGGA